MKLTKFAIALLFASALTAGAYASGSGGHDHGDSHMEGDSHDMHSAMPDRTIEIVARDIEFSVTEISVSQGETIRFVIHNEGVIDHDFTIGDRTTQDAHREEMMAMMGSMDGMMGAHDHGATNAVMIPPGETRELIWTFSEDQQIEFGCNIPGHYEAGMKGTFTVEG